MRQAKHLVLVVLCCLSAGAAALGAEQLYDVRQFGAKPDGKTLSTESIQKAIDRCAADGGGTVYLPPGVFLSGTIYMKSGGTGRSPRLCPAGRLAAQCRRLQPEDLRPVSALAGAQR